MFNLYTNRNVKMTNCGLTCCKEMCIGSALADILNFGKSKASCADISGLPGYTGPHDNRRACKHVLLACGSKNEMSICVNFKCFSHKKQPIKTERSREAG